MTVKRGGLAASQHLEASVSTQDLGSNHSGEQHLGRGSYGGPATNKPRPSDSIGWKSRRPIRWDFNGLRVNMGWFEGYVRSMEPYEDGYTAELCCVEDDIKGGLANMERVLAPKGTVRRLQLRVGDPVRFTVQMFAETQGFQCRANNV